MGCGRLQGARATPTSHCLTTTFATQACAASTSSTSPRKVMARPKRSGRCDALAEARVGEGGVYSAYITRDTRAANSLPS